MNRIKYYTKGLLVAIMAIAGLTLTSCKDQPDKYETTDGTPSVDYIRNLSTEIKSSRDAADMHYTNGELVLEASPQNTLALIGNNLRSVVKIMFNDKQAVLNNSYITDNVLIVDVPKGVPEKVTDKIYLYDTNNQVTTVDFKVVIPAPSINTMSCEYAKPGTIAKVIGDYIVTYEDSPLEVYFKNPTRRGSRCRTPATAAASPADRRRRRAPGCNGKRTHTPGRLAWCRKRRESRACPAA